MQLEADAREAMPYVRAARTILCHLPLSNRLEH